jgi:hypothetical protein
VVELGKNLVYDAGIGLIKEYGAESILGKGGINTFAWSRGAGLELNLLGAEGARAKGKDSLLGGGIGGAKLEGVADVEHPKPIVVRGY